MVSTTTTRSPGRACQPKVQGDFFVFTSSRDQYYFETAQRFGLDSLPAGCFWLYSLSLCTREAEPAKVCPVSEGFDMEIAIPDRNSTTHSSWLAEARELG
jgi:hypothetical protein